nr:DUF3658 domain-containing protein [Paenibacillus agilis]
MQYTVNGKLTAVLVDYYDVFLLEHVTDDYQLAARVVGAVMGDSNLVVGDMYLAFGVRQLIDEGKLDYRGELGSLRDYEIRLK